MLWLRMQGHTYVFLTSLLVHGTEILLIDCSDVQLYATVALKMQRMSARINDKKKRKKKEIFSTECSRFVSLGS